MAEFWAVVFIILLVLCLLSLIFTLPGNWLMVGLVAVWKWLHPDMDSGWSFVIILLGLAGLSEGLQYVSQIWSVRRYGGSKRANWWSIIGSVIGAIALAPIAFGFGAIPGAFAGAYAGGYLAEFSQGKNRSEAHRSAMGAFFGSVFGMVVKFGIGAFMLMLTARHIWPA
ncbi:MAG: DUF456 domain-containing protein [Desulfovibrio sp.]|uniref:DUF456 domain-containing protein n=1 Tax=Desulfovibrio sp. 7SRBS1 TaxID=3378064 RepID=UPI003B3FF647